VPARNVMHTLELTRVVTTGALLDVLLAPNSIRLSTDEALCFGSVEDLVDVFPAAAIVEPETGLSGAWFAETDIRSRLASLAEWQLPARMKSGTAVVAQGLIAGIPAKVWLPIGDGEALLLVATAHAHEMEERL
jgi:hypothetical protein